MLLQGRAATILVWLIGFYFPEARAITHPLFFDYPEDKRAKGIWDEYFYGPEYLVAPTWRTGKREILSFGRKLGGFLELLKGTSGTITIVYRAELDPCPCLKGWRMFHEL